MNPEKWTKGPWTFEALCFDRRIPIRGGRTVFGRPYNVALVNRPGSARAGEDCANAHLIAAAPALYEALKEACEVIKDLSRYANNNGAMIDDETFAEGLAALAQARGEPQ